jgi:PAS domain S-box-containing protein
MNREPIRILLIEDNPGDARLLQELLAEAEGEAFQLSQVDRLSTGLKRLAEEEINIILLDLSLPDSQGPETFAWLHARVPDIPIIVLTGLENETLGLALVQSGAQDYLIKGQVSGHLLMRSIRFAIERRRMAEEIKVRVQQQTAVAELGQRALASVELVALLNEAVLLIAKTLEVEYSYVLELQPDKELLYLRAGTGWPAALIGQMTIDTKLLSPPGYTLLRAEPVIIEDFSLETHFSGLPLFDDYGVVSGVSVVIEGQDWPFGVLGAYSKRPRPFSQDDVHFLQTAAHVLAAAIERKRAEESLSLNKELLRQILNTNPNIIFVKDRSARIILANQALANSYRMRLEQLIGRSQIELHTQAGMSQEELQQYLADDREVIETALPKTILEQYTHRDGSLHWNHTRKFPLDLADGSRGVLVISEDITERKQAEEKILQLNAELERRVEERTADLSRANSELAKAVRAKDEFLASMSHELRTPLTAILGLAEVLQEQTRGPLNERQLKSLHTIEESGRHLLSLINDILDLSKIEAGKLELQAEAVSVEMICQTSLQFIKEIAAKKKITVSFNLANKQATLQADTRRLKQILVNLLSNAVKFTPEGGQVGLEVIEEPEHETIHLVTWDTGIGITPENLARLFQPFIQLDSSLSREYEGTGLGLALVSRLVDLHRGSVSIESQVGQGSRFTISLPYQAAPEAVQMLELKEEEEIEEIHAFRQALIIEDSPTAAEQITRYLKELEIQVWVHSSGKGAVDQATESQPDFIILDILFPDLSGWEILAQLKAGVRTRDIPVIVVSVVDEQPTALALGAVEYLVKPITRRQLHQALSRVTGQRAEGQPALIIQPELEPAPSPPLILLVEDTETNIKFLVDYLADKGYRIVVARNGAEAIERAREVRPALILMDIQMPVMDGLEATRQIRALAGFSEVPIIALTALAMPGDQERCLAAGANDYMSKPVSLKNLISSIESHLEPVKG